jgi:hypothetical protein
VLLSSSGLVWLAAASVVGTLFLACDPGSAGPVSSSSSSSSGAGGAGGASSSSGAGGFTFTTGSGGSPACDGGVADVTPVPCDASADVSFATDVQPILSGCTGELCHGPWLYASVVGKAATECCDGRLLVAPGDPAHSYLLDKIRAHDLCRGAPMPLGLPPLPDAKAQAIADWICLGAPKN